MSFTKASFLLVFLILYSVVLGQKRNTPYSTTQNFLAYRFGLAYPFFSNGSKLAEYSSGSGIYVFSNKNVNYSFHGGMELGHFFGRQFSIALSPSLIYSKLTKTDFHYEFWDVSEMRLIRESNGDMHFSHFSLLVPLEFKFLFKEKFEFAAGVFVLKPFTDLEYNEAAETNYLYRLPNGHYASYNPPKVYGSNIDKYKNWRRYPRSGVHGQLSFLLQARDWKQTRIEIEYFHAMTRSNFQVYEKWIVVAFKKMFFQ